MKDLLSGTVEGLLKVELHEQLEYAPKWSVREGVPSTPRIIIPSLKHSYIARDTRLNTLSQYKAIKKVKLIL